MEADKGKKKLNQLAKWLQQEYPSASSSLLEGIDEMFTINKLGLPKELRRCLDSTQLFRLLQGREVSNPQPHVIRRIYKPLFAIA